MCFIIPAIMKAREVSEIRRLSIIRKSAKALKAVKRFRITPIAA